MYNFLYVKTNMQIEVCTILKKQKEMEREPLEAFYCSCFVFEIYWIFFLWM